MTKRIEVEIVEKAEWDEGLHPRDERGRFGSGGGGGGSKPSGQKPLSDRITNVMTTHDVPMNSDSKAKQERTAEAMASKVGLYKPEKNYTVGTPALAGALREAFGAGLHSGPNNDSGAWLRAEEIQHARLASGEDSAAYDTRRVGHAAEPDNISARDNMIREAFEDREDMSRTWRELHQPRDVNVSGKEVRDALKMAYAEGVRAHIVVRANAENLRLKDPTTAASTREREREQRLVRSPAGRGTTPVGGQGGPYGSRPYGKLKR